MSRETTRIGVDTILDNMTEALVVVDTAGRIVFYNKAASSYENLIQAPLEVGRVLFDLLPHEQSALMEFMIREVTTKQQPQSAESVFSHPTGHTVFFEVNYNPVLTEQRVVKEICIVGRDITPQKAFEKKTTQLIRELSNLIESANAVIFGVDAQGYITEWNKESARLSGFEKNDVLAQRWTLITEPGQEQRFATVIDTVLRGEAVTNCEFRIRGRETDGLTLLLSGTPKISPAGKVVGALFVGQDVTELSEYRESLEKKVRDRTLQLREALQKEKELVEIKNRFVSIASHEFKIPLNAINASVQALKQMRQLDNYSREKLDGIEMHVGRMKGLLEDVLTVGRNEVSKLKPSYETIDLAMFLNNLADEVLLAVNHSHVIVRDFPDGPVVIESDEKLLRNIFVNLISNAIKFSPEAREVIVSLQKEKAAMTVSIQDFGIGIPGKDQERVFEPFNRAANTAGIKGTGLGLSIVRKAAESIGARIDLHSNIGEGTVFKVTLPIAAVRAD